jgi:hypothetical protein
MFTICVECKFNPFDLSIFLRSLENSDYEALMKEIEAQVDNKEWLNKEGHPFGFRAMASRVRQLIVSLDVMTASNKYMSRQMRAIELTRNVTSQGGSIGSTLPTPPGVVSSGQGPSTTRSRVIVPSNSKRQKPGAVPTTSKKMRVTRIGELSTTSAITEVPSSLEPGEKTDYNETKTMYKKFWSECQDCFVFEVDKKFSISIDQMVRAPKDWTIWEYEEKGMNKTLHYLCHMPDPSTKQTHCVMPDTEEKPIDWGSIANGTFFIINEQHSVGASQKMLASDLPEAMTKPFSRWNCFIVWSKDKNRLRQISGSYNRCNHFSMFKPTWATNVLSVGFMWTELGRPTPPKSATKVGRVVRRTKKNATNNAKYKVLRKHHLSFAYQLTRLSFRSSRPKSRI